MKIINQMDDLELLLQILPQRVAKYIEEHQDRHVLTEVVLDLGAFPEVRFSDTVYRLSELGEITMEDIQGISNKVGTFDSDNRAGIERTLHRISAIRNRAGKIIGLTCRVGRAVAGTVEFIRDIVESGQNCLFLGPPGIGKTTILRETARVLSDESHKRVIVVDTSNEIAGDGDISHPGIGFARRLQVPTPEQQDAVMIEAVQNHMPEVIIVDEIGTEEETRAARTIAERGVQLVATAHGHSLHNLIKNPVLSDLVGGVQHVVIGDEEAKFRGTNKTVLERKSLPTFDSVIEIRAREKFAIYNPVARYIDAHLASDPLEPEIRTRFTQVEEAKASEIIEESQEAVTNRFDQVTLFTYGINLDRVKMVVEMLEVPVNVTQQIGEAQFVLTVRSQVRSKSKTKLNRMLDGREIPMHVVSSQSTAQLTKFFREYFQIPESDEELEREALYEIRQACDKVNHESRVVEVMPRNNYIRHAQHRVSQEMGLNSMSVGEEPNRRVRVYPRTSS